MKLTFPVGSVIKCFVILSNIKIKQTAKKKNFFFCSTPRGTQMCLGFREHGLITSRASRTLKLLFSLGVTLFL